MEEVILVNSNDEEIGTMEKLEAHQKGILHRAFSVLLFNSKGELLLQKRAKTKYHSAGLWTNTCCSHPLPCENIHEATKRKLFQEMGIDFSPIFLYKFTYKEQLDSQLTEHECDYVFVGDFEGKPVLNPHEAEDWKYMSLTALRQDIQTNPHSYTAWFKLILEHKQIHQITFPISKHMLSN